MTFIMAAITWLVLGWDAYLCDRKVHESVDIVYAPLEIVDPMCRSLATRTDDGEKITKKHTIYGCFIPDGSGRALILQINHPEVLRHELNHARDYFCR